MPSAPRHTPFVGMVRGVLAAGMVGSLVIATAGWVLRDEEGGWSALAGAGLAFGAILVGLLAMRLVIAGDPGISMAGALVVYLGQLILVALVVLALRDAGWLDGRAFAGGAIAETVLLQVGQIAGYVRGRHEIYPEGGAA